jgi:hypothetical protein
MARRTTEPDVQPVDEPTGDRVTEPAPAPDDDQAQRVDEPAPEPATAPDGGPVQRVDEPDTQPVDAPASGDSDDDQVARRVADAEAELAAARAQAAARLPGGGYVIATTALYVHGGARAHNAGDRVPVGNVVPNGWEILVRPPNDGE